ncbi:SLAC1 anion channel family protein [Methylobacterium planeticum]|uniref:C4-dicarboxylate ABC transporter n=1 Tax=Methylobacterium planeticum TaxID=2615211 RepID=A0A6N6MSD6_9HYPH|nr:SLAC1 anion channel family protein [Methylobacterium planeticum]KAB1074211.1 C4-dicarboxylate ABC transporter [Methylobacterium planeticum]
MSTLLASEAASEDAPAGRGRFKARFAYLPVSLFGAVMGLVGLAAVWRLAAERYGAPGLVADLIGWCALGAFLALAVAYGLKAVTAPGAVRAEFAHPIAGNLFGTVLISLLLLPIVLVRLSPLLAEAFWIAGTAGMVIFAFVIVSRWMGSRQQVAHATPAWIVPVVGLLDVPLAVPALGLSHTHGITVFALSTGLFFAVPLFTLIFSRLLFEEPLPAALRPTLMILVAPFAVGFSSYVATTGGVDAFAEGLFLLSLFVLAVLVGQLRSLAAACPFRVSWWAVSFPLAASAGAALRYAPYADSPVADAVAIGLLAFATLVIAALAARTLLGIARGELQALSG